MITHFCFNSSILFLSFRTTLLCLIKKARFLKPIKIQAPFVSLENSVKINQEVMMVRTPCCKAELGLKKGAWTPEEDHKLLTYLNRHGEGGWRTLPEKTGLKRCGKSCRLRWANYLRPDIKRGEFSEDEECSIISLHALHGNKWSAIARGLPGRTDNEIKNYWNTHIKKRLIKKGIDPVTHKSLNSDTDKSQTINQTKNKKSSAMFLNKVANRFGKTINQTILSEIIGTITTSYTTTTTSVSFDSELDKSTSSSLAQTSDLMYCDNVIDINNNNIDDEDTIGFLNDEDFMMLEESFVEFTQFLLHEDENVEVTPVYECRNVFDEIDNYFG